MLPLLLLLLLLLLDEEVAPPCQFWGTPGELAGLASKVNGLSAKSGAPLLTWLYSFGATFLPVSPLSFAVKSYRSSWRSVRSGSSPGERALLPLSVVSVV